MGWKDIRWTGRLWIAVTACIAFAALFAALVPRGCEDCIKPGEILQSVANLIGAAIGTFGAFMVARWSLGQAERDRLEHRAELALLTMNSILDLLEQLDRWSMAFNNLDGGFIETVKFEQLINKYAKAIVRTSSALRRERVASFPGLEVTLAALESSYSDLKTFLGQSTGSSGNIGDTEFLSNSYRAFVSRVVVTAGCIESIHLQYQKAARLAGHKIAFKKQAEKIARIKVAAEDLARRTAPDVLHN